MVGGMKANSPISVAVLTTALLLSGCASAPQWETTDKQPLITDLIVDKTIRMEIKKPSSAGAEKKLIEMGVDNPDTLWMRDNIDEMEQAPFDGCVCILTSDSRRQPPYDRRALGDFSFWQWSNRKFTHAELQQGIKAMADTDFKKFTDVFIRIDTGRPGTIDWFDERVMNILVHNMGLAARAVREGGVKGLFFDPESYYGPMWTYAKQAHSDSKTFEEYVAKVRQVGADIMEICEKEYAEITIVIMRSYITVYGIGSTYPD